MKEDLRRALLLGAAILVPPLCQFLIVSFLARATSVELGQALQTVSLLLLPALGAAAVAYLTRTGLVAGAYFVVMVGALWIIGASVIIRTRGYL